MRATWWRNDASILPSSWMPRDVINDPMPGMEDLLYAVSVCDLDGDGDLDLVSPIRSTADIGDPYINQAVAFSESGVRARFYSLRDKLPQTKAMGPRFPQGFFFSREGSPGSFQREKTIDIPCTYIGRVVREPGERCCARGERVEYALRVR